MDATIGVFSSAQGKEFSVENDAYNSYCPCTEKASADKAGVFCTSFCQKSKGELK